MNNILSPAILLLNKLRFSQKIFLLGSIVIPIIIYLSIALHQQLNKVIVDSTIQLKGIVQVTAVNDLIQLLQQNRGLSAANIGNRDAFSDLHLKKEHETEIAFYEVVNNLDYSLFDKALVEKLTQKWEEILENQNLDSLELSFARHTELIDELRNLLASMGDDYKLVTQGVLPSYYMVDMLLNNMSETTENLGKLRGLTLGVLSSQHLSKISRLELIRTEVSLNESIDSFRHNLTKIIQYSPSLEPELSFVHSRLNQDRQYITQVLKSDIYSEQLETVSYEFWLTMTENIDNLYKLMHQPLIPNINTHLEQRIIDTSSFINTTVNISVFLLLLTVYFMLALQRALRINIHNIREASYEYSQGNLNTRIDLISDDELRDISLSINLMADKANQAQEKINKQKQHFENLFENAPVSYALNSSNQEITHLNREFIATFGYTLNDIPTLSDWWKRAYPNPQYQKQVLALWKSHVDEMNSGKDTHPVEVRIKTKSGKVKTALVSIAMLDENTSRDSLVILYDITARKLAEEQLNLSARVFRESHDGITITDRKGLITDVNPAFCEITGFSKQEVIGQNSSILGSGKQSPEFYNDMWKSVNEQGHWQGEIWNRKKNGELYAELLSISTLKDDDGNILNHVGIFSDITQSKKQQDKLNLMAHYDVLTKLPNRVLFADRFTQAIAHSDRTKTQLAVCFLDLDNFKPVNDNYGHEIGDQLLIEVSQRIKNNIRSEDTVSRQGGDEFTLLLGDIESYAQCEETLARIQDSLSQPYLIEDVSHKISASTGVTLYPSDEGDIDTLIRHADQAMYQAKQLGRNCYHLFNTKLDQEISYKHHRLEEIRFALMNNQFQLYYQPKINMGTGNVYGAEALIRWIHPENGLIPPLEFLPIIEGSELEIEIGDWVIEQALTQLSNWKKEGIALEISVNISSHHLQSGSFVEQLELILEKHSSIDSQYLQLEILESSALGDIQTIRNIIKTCQEALGVSIALDDFGTGYSSLTHLRSLPANIVKVDQSFVRDMLDDPNDFAIIDGVLGLADSFNRKVIAEGVETTEHGLMLLLMGCEDAQGYGIARPMPVNIFSEWLEAYTPNQEWINCSNKKRTLKETKLKLFKLSLLRWINYFEENIRSPHDNDSAWPIMVRKKCLCGYWIKRAYQEKLFDKAWLDVLGEEHEKIHFLADDILVMYQDGDIDTARDNLEVMQEPYLEINKLIGAI